ncbi:MAG TPA: ATP-binding cassette domain-containing protein [Actinomycetales bacterium]|nr:ATP-binding cassette domain-containing protein [Actinomycetales bacterium]
MRRISDDFPILSVRGLAKAYAGVPVIDEMDVVVAVGQVVALAGANGTGKTTTLRCVVGSESPDAGEVLLHGRPFDESDPATRREMCSLLDDWAWFPDLTVHEHLSLFARAHATPDAVLVVDQALETLGLDGLGDRLPGTLSSGQMRRFALAQALVRPWSLLVLDEPEQRLDREGRVWLGRYLKEMAGQGRGVLMASHDDDVLAESGAAVHRLDGQ